MAKVSKWFKESWDEAVIYLATLAAVFVAPYLGSAAIGESFKIEVNWGFMLIGAVIAFFVVVRNEAKGFDPNDDAKTVKAKREAKRRNLATRLSVCMANGFVWPSLIGVAFNGVKALATLVEGK